MIHFTASLGIDVVSTEPCNAKATSVAWNGLADTHCDYGVGCHAANGYEHFSVFVLSIVSIGLAKS